MKTSSLLALLLTSACATALPARDGADPGTAAAPGADEPCGAVAELPGPDACAAGPLCSARERVQIACELRRAIRRRYVFYPVKPAMLAADGRPGFDPDRHLDACVEAERAVPVEEDPLRFYDRMRRCAAAFEDGHLLVRVPGGVPQVAIGIELRRVAGGKVYVANREPRLAGAFAADPPAAEALSSLAPGTEVLAIDGRPVSDAIAELARFLPASSDAARAERAVDALTRRDFAYPARREATFTIAKGGVRREVSLPWWIAPAAERNALARAYVRASGIATTDRIDWRAEARARWGGESTGGVRRGDPILPPGEALRLQAYDGDGGLLAARLGEASSGAGRPFCYAQFLTFHTETLAALGKRRPFLDVVEEFVRGCNERQLDLVLDLRQNEGGYLSHSTALAEMLLPDGDSSPGGALLLRATGFNERVYRERAPMLGGPSRPSSSYGSGPEHVLEALRNARRTRDEFTPAFLDAPLEVDEAVGGFEGRVVALLSPSCMSACERLAGLLREGGRATLVGGPTEGAGGSQQETKDLKALWTDTSGRLSVSIPNAAMGVQRSGAAAVDDATVSTFFGALALENRPVEPSVPYTTRLEDLTEHGRGWLEQAKLALRGVQSSSLR